MTSLLKGALLIEEATKSLHKTKTRVIYSFKKPAAMQMQFQSTQTSNRNDPLYFTKNERNFPIQLQVTNSGIVNSKNARLQGKTIANFNKPYLKPDILQTVTI